MKRQHRQLAVWSEAMDLVTEIYRLSSLMPAEERYGLVSQMRRSAVSIPANVAEGAARGSTKELVQFLSIALGSASELDTHIEVVRRLGYAADLAPAQAKLDSVAVQLAAMRSKLRARARS
jgi:four helix bundle protein